MVWFVHKTKESLFIYRFQAVKKSSCVAQSDRAEILL